MIKKLINQLFSPSNITENYACPNCWGISQWQEKDCPQFFDLDKGQASEVSSRNGFIRTFVRTFIG